MEEVNENIAQYWKWTYKGNDVESIRVVADEDSTAKLKSYNYRVVFVKNGHEIDMRGRCSAGQKVLASIVIRLALAETFSKGCALFCLDEPTTNLDVKHTESLALSIREIISLKGGKQGRFQLIVITHDKNFISAIGRDYTDSCILVSRDEKGWSTVKEVELSSLEN